MSAAYIAAIINLAATGNMNDALFTRLSDVDCGVIIAAVKADGALRVATLHPNCAGMVDTVILSAAR